MDYKAAIINCIDRIPDENTQVLKKLYEIAKKELSHTRCAPSIRPDKKKDKDCLDSVALWMSFPHNRTL